MIALTFLEIRMAGFDASAVLLLKEADGPRILPVWITAGAAASILAALEGEDPAHPDTHDLMIEALAAVDAVVERVQLLSEADGVTESVLIVNNMAVACRTSDGVSLALRCGASMEATETVMDACALVFADADTDVLSESDAVAQFREFLSSVNPEDFDEPPRPPLS